MGDSAVVVGSGDWAQLVRATSTAGFLSTSNDAYGITSPFYQGSGEKAWAKYSPVIKRKLYAWTVDGASSLSQLVLAGNKAVVLGQQYAVKYSGSDTIVVTDFDATYVSWNSGGQKNTLTLGNPLSSIPEMVFTWDGVVGVAAGTSEEALVAKTPLSLVTASTTASQVVCTSSVPKLWVTEGYHSTAEVTVGGVVKTVKVLAVAETLGTYTLQIPEQSAPPTTIAKPSCFIECIAPISLSYVDSGTLVSATYPTEVVFGNAIRQVKFEVSAASVGTAVPGIQVDIWSEV